MVERSDFYVYVIFRPNGEPCYVGKGQKKRYKFHAWRSHNKRLARIYALAGSDLPIWKCREGLTDKEALETEIAMIAALGRLDKGTGPLVNLTDGGEGSAGHVRSPETSKKIGDKLRGKKHTAETRAKISAAGKGRKHSPESIAKRAAAIRGTKWSEESRAKITGRCGRKHTAESIEKMREAHRGFKQSPEHIAKRTAHRKGVPASPALREVLVKRNKARAGKPVQKVYPYAYCC